MSMELPSVAPLRPEPRSPTSEDAAQSSARLSKVAPVQRTRRKRGILVYDLETYATGFADPNWVPQVITCVAWTFLDSGDVRSEASIDYAEWGMMPHLQSEAILRMLEPFLAALDNASAVMTYNGKRFDQPVLNGTMFYCGLPPLSEVKVYDLHDFGKIKGVKRGLDNIAVHLGAKEEKLAMNHAQWAEGYLEPGWKTIKERARSDVRLTEEVYHLKNELGWIRPPKMWVP